MMKRAWFAPKELKDENISMVSGESICHTGLIMYRRKVLLY